MPTKARRILLSARERADWTNVKRVAISPPYVDDCEMLTHGTGKELFKRYVKYVCQQRKPESGRGCKSLQDTVLEAILQLMPSIDNVDDWPTFLVQRIWEAVDRRCILNFHCWKILSKAVRQEPDATLGMLHYRETIDRPKLALHDYAKPLTSNSFDFITCLTITIQLPIPDLVKLAKMSNLGILEILNLEGDISIGVDGNCDIGNNLVRAWSREARDNQAFSVLRILRLSNQSNVTHKSICYIHDFPALRIFDIRGCGADDEQLAAAEVIEALRLGWKVTPDVKKECRLASKYHDIRSAKTPKGLLWPKSIISRVDRPTALESAPKTNTSHISQDLACSNTSHSIYSATDFLTLEGSTGGTSQKDNEWASLDRELFRVVHGWTSKTENRITDAWEFENTECWALLGNACQDSDLIRAGVKDVTKAARAGHRLISPAPAAYIRLGRISTSQRIDMSARALRRGLVLIRLEVPAPPPPKVQPQQVEKLKEQKRIKVSAFRVRKSKKRKLEGLLGDFHS